MHESALSLCSDCSFSSVTVLDRQKFRVLLWLTRSRGVERMTHCCRNRCVCQFSYLTGCCISISLVTRLWCAQSQSQLEVCFVKGSKCTEWMSSCVWGGKAPNLLKIHGAKNSYELNILHPWFVYLLFSSKVNRRPPQEMGQNSPLRKILILSYLTASWRKSSMVWKIMYSRVNA